MANEVDPGKLSDSFGVELVRSLRPMVRAVRRWLPRAVGGSGGIEQLQEDITKRWPDKKIEDTVRRTGFKVERQSSRVWKGSGLDAGYNGDELIDIWTRDAFKRIASVRDGVAEGMRRDLIDALTRGQSSDDLIRRWRTKGIPVEFGTMEGRIRVIAHHQTNMLHARVQAERAAAVGATRFEWRTKGDSRVRDTHRPLDRTQWLYSDPPPIGLPGHEPGCRCRAVTIVDFDVGPRVGGR